MFIILGLVSGGLTKFHLKIRATTKGQTSHNFDQELALLVSWPLLYIHRVHSHDAQVKMAAEQQQQNILRGVKLAQTYSIALPRSPPMRLEDQSRAFIASFKLERNWSM